MSDESTLHVGDVVCIGKGKTLWSIERMPWACTYPDCVVYLFDLRSQAGRRLSMGIRSDKPRLTLVWTLEEVVLGAEVLATA